MTWHGLAQCQRFTISGLNENSVCHMLGTIPWSTTSPIAMINKIKRTSATICSLLKRSAIPMLSVPSLSRIIRGRLIYILPPYLHLVHYLYVFFVKNVPYKHFDLRIQVIGSWNGCPNFGWRSHFWMDIAGFLDAQHEKTGYPRWISCKD